MNDDMAEAKI